MGCQKTLLTTLFMIQIQSSKKFMMRVLFLWSSQLLRDIMVPYLPMDRQAVVRHIQCLEYLMTPT